MPRQRTTRDEWTIQGNYGGGWEDVSAYKTWRECREDLRLYRENQPEYPHRAIVRSVKIATS